MLSLSYFKLICNPYKYDQRVFSFDGNVHCSAQGFGNFRGGCAEISEGEEPRVGKADFERGAMNPFQIMWI